MRFLAVLLIMHVIVVTSPITVSAHPPTEENKMDATDCHYTSGAGGEKHYHENGTHEIEIPCREMQGSFIDNPIYIALGFILVGIIGATVLGTSLG